MSLPPVVSDPVWCGQRTYKALHDWGPWNFKMDACGTPVRVCRFCGGRKPDG